MALASVLFDIIVLIYGSAWLSWHNRPATAGQWPGSAAARFAAGLMLLGYGLSALLGQIPALDLASTELLMQQLSLYAALPILVCSHLAERLGYHWSRQIWGRVFLVWCVLFELGRRNAMLDTILWVTLAMGAVTLVLPWLLPKRLSGLEPPLTDAEKRLHLLLPALIWFMLFATQAGQQTPTVSMTLWLGVAALALNYAQKVSYRLASTETVDNGHAEQADHPDDHQS